jgi:hypothetical protein
MFDGLRQLINGYETYLQLVEISQPTRTQISLMFRQQN